MSLLSVKFSQEMVLWKASFQHRGITHINTQRHYEKTFQKENIVDKDYVFDLFILQGRTYMTFITDDSLVIKVNEDFFERSINMVKFQIN